MPVRDLARS